MSASEGLGDNNYCRNPSQDTDQFEIWCWTGDVSSPLKEECRPLLISVKEKTLSYWSDIREIDTQPAILYFILHVHIYKGHDFTYPTKITIRGCDNEGNAVSNPAAIADAEMPYKKTDNCKC